MRRTARTCARSLGLALLWGWCLAGALPAHAQQAASPDLIDDYTTYSYAKIADFTPAVLPVTRTFPRNIKSLKLTIVGGSADDLGYVGGMLVTTVPGCSRGVGQVASPVDVTSQVAVSGNTASFTLTAIETCCCYTGWGGASFHWQVELEPACNEQLCSAQCAPGTPDLVPSTSLSWSSKHTVSCGPLGGDAGAGIKFKGAGSFDPAQCAGGCKSKGKGSGQFDAELYACGITATASGAVEYEQSSTFEKSCNMDACGMQCDPNRYCTDASSVFSGKVEQSESVKTFALKNRVFSRGSRSFGVSGSCEAKLKFSGGVKGGAKSQENHGSANAACRTCTGGTGEASLEGAGSGGCKVDVSVGSHKLALDCKDCMELKLATTFKGSRDDCGGDGAQNCAGSSVTASAKAGLPKACRTFFGMRVKANYDWKFDLTCAGDSCGQDFACTPKADGSAKLSIDYNTKC
ncbi:hypothetical protein FGE12_11495 [Aggregicoccus sp. 17bor-14]|uniref:hypothetical protein n=1 Tax=Myxococcaceae TaxID=31 RepID=UPI00129D1FCD|nr:MULTISPECIES: hypothetical protein [Myxococcaceae]MBF5043009.1 hypothetical protein [Simulacricoccus sp. 17bor-14]MRI88774.1 hypothetical protein [Aggregicoccus sp. 17bor-14]